MPMTPKAIAVLVLASAVLSACASREEIAGKKAAAEQVAQGDREKRCASFGYQRGTPDYSKCLESLYLQDQQLAAAEEANRRARLQAAAQGLQQAGAALQSISPPPPPPQPMIRCQTFGNTTTCQ
jgi:hypothetical protein